MFVQDTTSERIASLSHPSFFSVAVRQELLLRLLTHLELRDVDLRSHSERVCSLAVSIACHMGLDESDLVWLQVAAMLHDVGKLHVSPKILDKPRRLNRREIHLVRFHPVRGEQILREQGLPEIACQAVRSHHECYDGRGYPDGLTAEAIPLFARILRVADAYDAMTVDRPYRTALSPRAASRRLRTQAGKHFDPRVVECFLESAETGDEGLAWREDQEHDARPAQPFASMAAAR